MKPFTVTIEAYDTVEKVAGDGGNSAKVYIPKSWVGRRVRVLLLEPLEEETRNDKSG